MSNSRTWKFLFALVVAVCGPIGPAHAAWFVSFVSGTGKVGNDCSRGSPCISFADAIAQTAPGGQIVVLDSYAYGPALITQSLSIVNDSAGTAVDCCAVYPMPSGIDAELVVNAGPNDVVTIQGLTFNPSGNVFPNSTAVLIQNAAQVNIERCTIRNQTGTGIVVAPSSSGPLAPTIAVNIHDTIVTGSGGAVRLASVPGVTVNASISQSVFKNNNGGGMRIEGTSGGTVAAFISDTVSSMNAGNGVVALSGPGNVAAHITRSVLAGNLASGVQANANAGGVSTVTVRASALLNNAAGAANFFGGGASLRTFGDNSVNGPPGTGFSGPASLQ